MTEELVVGVASVVDAQVAVVVQGRVALDVGAEAELVRSWRTNAVEMELRAEFGLRRRVRVQGEGRHRRRPVGPEVALRAPARLARRYEHHPVLLCDLCADEVRQAQLALGARELHLVGRLHAPDVQLPGILVVPPPVVAVARAPAAVADVVGRGLQGRANAELPGRNARRGLGDKLAAQERVLLVGNGALQINTTAELRVHADAAGGAAARLRPCQHCERVPNHELSPLDGQHALVSQVADLELVRVFQAADAELADFLEEVEVLRAVDRVVRVLAVAHFVHAGGLWGPELEGGAAAGRLAVHPRPDDEGRLVGARGLPARGGIL
mmetsp:Transcript_107867/g.305722  ORF Transcript_107867/g.305722 Transcript_107867/m.305722 type:complete len:326 (-) Transcript_107867:144-1121(-)